MFDAVINLMIILIPVAIVIGRIVVNARNKRNPPPKPAQPRIPVHFEDDDNYFKKKSPAKTPETKSRVQTSSASLATRVPNGAFPPAAVSGTKPASAPGRNVAAASSGQRDFSFNLSHLSALKQAVVLAEILGPPKGIRD